MTPLLEQLAFWKMEFPERLARMRKERGMTQQQLADRASVHVVQIRRYEGGVSQPAVDILKRLAIALSTSADSLLFDQMERGPDEELRLQFEALSAMSAEEKELAKAMLDALIVKNQVAGAVQRFSTPAPKAKKATPKKAARTRERARA
ncbi:MAG TPA: helix-turn-helix transcriptional regulator [Burkholderiaceae bacterium]|nr:helix-turn-helix transcriptional regulator [Burkholderiaceae bacterium]